MNTWCVIVCYRPDLARLGRLCADLAAEGASIVLVDNTDVPGHDLAQLVPQAHLRSLGFNSGIAHAQNIGIRAALDAGAAAIALFDQDSQVAPGLLRALVAALSPGVPAVVSPLCYDDLSRDELPSMAVSRRGVSSVIQRDGSGSPYEVDIVISSGTVATREVYGVAGLLDEDLFIDFVDTEWCLRCRHHDIPIRVVPGAVMHHRIGNRAIDTGIMTVLVHNPARCYYQLRNCFLLFGKKHVPFLFSLKQLASVWVSRLLLLFFVDGRVPYLKAYLAALKDGITGVGGRNPRDVAA